MDKLNTKAIEEENTRAELEAMCADLAGLAGAPEIKGRTKADLTGGLADALADLYDAEPVKAIVWADRHGIEIVSPEVRAEHLGEPAPEAPEEPGEDQAQPEPEDAPEPEVAPQRIPLHRRQKHPAAMCRGYGVPGLGFGSVVDRPTYEFCSMYPHAPLTEDEVKDLRRQGHDVIVSRQWSAPREGGE